jgi:hypothetical protein
MALIDTAIEVLKAKSIRMPNVVKSPTNAQINQAESNLGLSFHPAFSRFFQKRVHTLCRIGKPIGLETPRLAIEI